jgi:hypothetical protein
MMKNFRQFAWLPILAMLMFLTGCQKLVDKWWHDHPGEVGCKIKKMIKKVDSSNPPITALFYYSSKGNLDSIITDVELGSVGPAYFYFKYDHKNRLIEYNTYYERSPEWYYELHKYVYTGNKITTDSAQIQVAGQYSEVRNLTYDSQGRVAGETGTATAEGSTEPLTPKTYTYDSNGNLEGVPDANYDDKVSFLRTDKVLMFTQRNYSRNNIKPALGYNAAELPSGFEFLESESPEYGFNHLGTPDTIEYYCK